MQQKLNASDKILNPAVIISALGYFVDIYDLIIFNVVKKQSLESLGYFGAEFQAKEEMLFSLQMIGMLLGGIMWGVLGDKKGRVSVLFGSIILYSLANLANAFVVDATQYAFCRFFAGVGLAGELGAGITLVVETMSKEKRGYGTMIIVTLGALGAVFASFVGKTDWQTAYIIGGCMGLALLLLRASAFESGMFKGMKEAKHLRKGDFMLLFENKERTLKYIYCIIIGLPVWFVIGILIAFANRFENDLGIIGGPVQVADAVMFAYIGLSVGDLLSGLLSQVFRSRRKVVVAYLIANMMLILIYLFSRDIHLSTFYFLCFALGTATGYWALFVTIASEQFGTNIRSTVTNTVPNFVRGAVVPITYSFTALTRLFIGDEVLAALVVGTVCVGLALFGIFQLKETFGKDLDYAEIS